jgi:hypothetical protein
MHRKQFSHILLLAALLTLANAWKPLHIDDATFYQFADHISRHPLDPYGFSLLSFSEMAPANKVTAPPVVVYWWGLGIALWGHHPVLWKLWLFPICLILVSSVVALARRFATGLEWPLAWMVILSPTILPGVNLMLDVPALAFNLLALVVLIRAVERDSLAWAALAGIVVGLSLETKYTGFLGVGALCLYSVVAGRWRLGFISSLIGVGLFALWEGLVHYRYGMSVFLSSFQFFQLGGGDTWEYKIYLLLPMVSFVGGLAPVLIPLGLAAHYRSRGLLLLASGLVIGVFASIVLLPEKRLNNLSAELPGLLAQIAQTNYLFTAMGLVVFVLAGVVLVRLWKAASRDEERATVCFLSLWLVLEIGGTVVLSPAMAGRRVMELTVILALVFGRLASVTIKTPDWRPWLHALVGFNLFLGIGYALLDYWEAETERRAVQEAARWIHQRQQGGTIWYAGYWGVQFYAEKEGMRQVIPSPPFAANRLQPVNMPPSAEPSILRKGDWLVVPDERIPKQRLVQLLPPSPELLEVAETVVASDPVHVRTVVCYYEGQVPLQHEEAPRLILFILRVKKDFVAESPAW